MKLRDRLVYVKDKPPGDKKSNLIYGFKCKGPGCTEAYVGEPNSPLKLVSVNTDAPAPRNIKRTTPFMNIPENQDISLMH